MFELSTSFHHMCTKFIWSDMFICVKWKAEQIDEAMSRMLNGEIQARFIVDNMMESFFFDENLWSWSVAFLTRFSTKTWLKRNMTQISKQIHSMFGGPEKFKQLVLKTTVEYWGRLTFLMFLWEEMEGFEILWEEFISTELNLYLKLCNSGKHEAASSLEYFRFVESKFGKELFNAKFIRENENNMAFRFSCRFGQMDLLQWLVEEIGLNEANDARAMDNYAIKFACKGGYVNVLLYLLEKFGLTRNDAQDDGNIALKLACENNQVLVLQCLKQNYGLNRADAIIDDNTPLILACSKGNITHIYYIYESNLINYIIIVL